MKRIVVAIALALFAFAGLAQNNTRVVKGFVRDSDGIALANVTIKAIGESATTTSVQGGIFEFKVSPYCQFIEASLEGYISAKAEIDGAMIILHLKADKKYAENKAKAEAAAKAAEEKAAKAAEKVAAKAKVEEKSYAAESKIANGNIEQPTKAKAAKPTFEKDDLAYDESKKMKYGQYVEVGYRLTLLNLLHTTSFNYIGGIRFNKYLFLGVGTGININYGYSYTSWDNYNGCIMPYRWYDYEIDTDGAISRVSIPLYLHFRTDFAFGKRWNPYAAVSFGGEFSTKHIKKYDYYYTYIDRLNYLTTDFAIGANYKINKKLQLHFGASLGIAADGFRFNNFGYYYEDRYNYYDYFGLSDLNIKFNVGLSF